jgi:hypothetical protein
MWNIGRLKLIFMAQMLTLATKSGTDQRLLALFGALSNSQAECQFDLSSRAAGLNLAQPNGESELATQASFR